MTNKANLVSIISFSRQLDTRGAFGFFWMVSLLLVIAWGFFALFTQFIEGHKVTGMRDNVVWGMYIANFIFFMGISYAGAIFSSLLVLFRVEWSSPIIRITQLISVLCGLIGPLYIFLCIGRLDRLHFILFYGRIPSPIFWDIVAIVTFLVGNITFLYLLLVPDLAYLRDNKELRLSKWRMKIYTFLSLNYHNTPEQQRHLRFAVDILAGILIPVSVILATILSWIFGMTLRPGWNSTIFGPYFVFAALYSGVGVIAIMMWVFRKRYNLKDYLTDRHFNYIAISIIVLAFSYGYFTFNEYFTIWYSFVEWDAQLIKKLFDFKQYGWWFIFSNYIGILVPLILISVPKFRTVNTIGIASIIIVAALWVKRYLVIVPTLETPLFPVQDIRPEYVKYTATWVEWALTFAGVALFLFLNTILTKIIPIVQIIEPISHKVLKRKKDLLGNVESGEGN